MNARATRDTPNPVDVHVGSRIRLRRKTLEISQEALAEHLQLTFQQVQKYERGANRVSASKLYDIAAALRTPIAWFFEGLPAPEDSLPSRPTAGQAAGQTVSRRLVDMVDDGMAAFLMTGTGPALARQWPRVPRAHQVPIAALVRELAGAAAEGAAGHPGLEG